VYNIGLDLGGTKIEGIILDRDGRTCFRERIPTEQENGYDGILDNIRKLYDLMCGDIAKAPHTLGIGTPGALSPRTGLLRNSNTVCMNGKPLKADLERKLGREIAMQNDANCFALAEALQGAGRGHEMVFGVIMGTGCGGGIVYRNRVWTGRMAIGGEWGHMSIDPSGPECYCGNRGCVETFISGGGAERRYTEQYGEKKSIRAIEDAYQAGDPDAVAFIATFMEHFGRAMANLLSVLDPDVVVLGGGVSKMPMLYRDGIKAVARHVFSDSLETPIVQHQLGDSAGVIGAALIGL